MRPSGKTAGMFSVKAPDESMLMFLPFSSQRCSVALWASQHPMERLQRVEQKAMSPSGMTTGRFLMTWTPRIATSG